VQSNNSNKQFNNDHDNNNTFKKRRIEDQNEFNKISFINQFNNISLTDDQRNFLESNICNDDEQLLFKIIQNNSDWKRYIYNKRYCYKCAIIDHQTNQCKIKSISRNIDDNLNIIVPSDEFEEINHLNNPSQL
jgi:hypothetical protein